MCREVHGGYRRQKQVMGYKWCVRERLQGDSPLNVIVCMGVLVCCVRGLIN